MTDTFIPYARQSLTEDDIAAVVDVLRGNWLTQGPNIVAFEEAVATRVGADFAVAVATGTAALHCACYAAGVGPGDNIITSPITFAASGNCALYLGADVKFVDIRPDTYCFDPEKLEAAITPETRAIVPIDYTGQPCDIDPINEIAKRHGIAVIQDSAHALGAEYKSSPVGALSDMSIFSFHPVKHIAMGEGGLVATNDEELAARIRLFRTHGISNEPSMMQLQDQAADRASDKTRDMNGPEKAPWYYEMQALGFNYRITDIQCALGTSQLKKLDKFLQRRREIASAYNDAFSQSPLLTIPFQEADRQSAWHLYMLRLNLDKMTKTRRQVFDDLRSSGIGVHVHYIPVHLLPYYRDRYGHDRGDFPEAESYYDSALTIPMFPAMTDDEVDRVISTVIEVVG
ncbi:MAG: UDP-4-amino-4,6-dideoxy-N-acetyl-beta-L-altrosamine transaminase [Rhodospirillaceae bacterium]|nr:UDP-4-amino-4,6-dideoxy-N-acetyl-beta-L-altrosamine transaminase [Rhodospirillaceae bacterium]